ncbi:MAG: glycosyltransferase family 4 protein [Deltaproteobacteria bacterium]|nr:glycosyltransferase family 4 protein [Deltaproteobacteria bacterium]
MLQKRGHEVEIFTSSAENEKIEHDGLIVHRVNHKTYLNTFWARKLQKHLLHTLDVLFRGYYLKKQFTGEHRKKPFDIVQASSYEAPALFLMKNSSVPIVTRMSSFSPLWRGAYGFKCNFDNALADWLEMYQLQKSHRVYAPSYCLSKALSAVTPVQVDVLRPPAILPGAFHYDDSVYRKIAAAKYFLFFGSLSRLKGVEFIWRNLTNFFKSNAEASFVFIGKYSLPPLTDALRAYEDRIIHFPAMSHAQLFPIIENAWAVVLPSIIDNLPNACLESMNLGKVVIGTRGASFDEIIEDGRNGFLVNYGDDTALAALLTRIAGLSAEQRSLIGREAKKTITGKCNADVQIELLENYFETARNTWKAAANGKPQHYT